MSRRENPTIEHLQAWGGWWRTKHQAQGWGGGVDFESGMKGGRDQYTHSDPTLAEIIATAADQQSLHQFIDRCMSEYYPVYRRMMQARYGLMAPWASIAQALNVSVDDCEVMHRYMLRHIAGHIRRYFKDRREAKRAAEARAEQTPERELCAA